MKGSLLNVRSAAFEGGKVHREEFARWEGTVDRKEEETSVRSCLSSLFSLEG